MLIKKYYGYQQELYLLTIILCLLTNIMFIDSQFGEKLGNLFDKGSPQWKWLIILCQPIQGCQKL